MRDMGNSSRPADDAYGRVTSPEKYAVVHDAAHACIAELVRRFAVTESNADASGLHLDGTADVVQAVRLQPSAADAAPLVIAFTPFPGLLVRFGNWHIEAFPRCGCDACDETPEEVVRELDDRVTALVEGRFREQLTGRFRPTRSAEFGAADGAWRRRSSERLHRGAVRSGMRRDRDWQPWPLRDEDSTR